MIRGWPYSIAAGLDRSAAARAGRCRPLDVVGAGRAPARAPKPTRPGPGRPPGFRNRHVATRYDVALTLITYQAHHKTGTKPPPHG